MKAAAEEIRLAVNLYSVLVKGVLELGFPVPPPRERRLSYISVHIPPQRRGSIVRACRTKIREPNKFSIASTGPWLEPS